MPRARLNTEEIHFRLAAPILARVKLFLHSEGENRVPYGAFGEFFTTLVLEFFSRRQLDLSPYLGTLPGECVVLANDHTLSLLISKLRESPDLQPPQ